MGKVSFHNDHGQLVGLGDNDHPQYVDAASLPIVLAAQTVSLVNDAAATVTEIDTGTLANSDTVVPTSKAVRTAISLGPESLWDIDIDGGLEPVTAVLTDANYELDGNGDIEPKA